MKDEYEDNLLTLSLPPGKLGVDIQKISASSSSPHQEENQGKCLVSSKQIDSRSPLEINDIIETLNGVVLKDVPSGLHGWVNLLKLHQDGKRIVQVRRWKKQGEVDLMLGHDLIESGVGRSSLSSTDSSKPMVSLTAIDSSHDIEEVSSSQVVSSFKNEPGEVSIDDNSSASNVSSEAGYNEFLQLLQSPPSGASIGGAPSLSFIATNEGIKDEQAGTSMEVKSDTSISQSKEEKGDDVFGKDDRASSLPSRSSGGEDTTPSEEDNDEQELDQDLAATGARDEVGMNVDDAAEGSLNESAMQMVPSDTIGETSAESIVKEVETTKSADDLLGALVKTAAVGTSSSHEDKFETFGKEGKVIQDPRSEEGLPTGDIGSACDEGAVSKVSSLDDGVSTKNEDDSVGTIPGGNVPDEHATAAEVSTTPPPPPESNIGGKEEVGESHHVAPSEPPVSGPELIEHDDEPLPTQQEGLVQLADNVGPVMHGTADEDADSKQSTQPLPGHPAGIEQIDDNNEPTAAFTSGEDETSTMKGDPSKTDLKPAAAATTMPAPTWGVEMIDNDASPDVGIPKLSQSVVTSTDVLAASHPLAVRPGSEEKRDEEEVFGESQAPLEASNVDQVQALEDSQGNDEQHSTGNSESEPAAITDEGGDIEEGIIQHATDSSIPHIPEAFLVGENGSNEDEVIIDAYATPLIPWWKQRRTRVLFGFVCLVIIAACVTVGITFSSSSSSLEPEIVTEVVEGSDPPSTSQSPSSTPTDQPSFEPTLSDAPSMSPTDCVDKMIASTAHMLQLPDIEFEPASYMKTTLDGFNAAVGVRELDTDTIHIIFYELEDNNDENEPIWVQNSYHIIEEYSEWNRAEIFDFTILISGGTAFVGLPYKTTSAGPRAGVVYVFEQNINATSPQESWRKVDKTIEPVDGSEDETFGSTIDALDDGNLLTVSAFDGNRVYIFEKNLQDTWTQRAVLELEYGPVSRLVARDSLLVLNIGSAIIDMYKYDKDMGTVQVMQDPILAKPWTVANFEAIAIKLFSFAGPEASIEDFTAYLEYLYTETDYGNLITNVAVSPNGDKFVYVTAKTKYLETGWEELGVSIYQRDPDDHANYTLIQYLNSSDYGSGFGWELDVDDDILVVSGLNQTYVFAQQNDGLFEEILVIGEKYDNMQLSGRHLLMTRDLLQLNDGFVEGENEVLALNLEICTQAMPTQMPSVSSSPSDLRSDHPSPAPTFTLNPSSTLRPSFHPSNSLAPTLCYDAEINIVTGVNTTGQISWQLYEKDNSKLVFSSDALEAGQVYEQRIPCLEPNKYLFSITEESGDGFGACDYCYYTIEVYDETPRYVAYSGQFFYNERVTFSIPQENDTYEGQPCHGDFYFALLTDYRPDRTSWTLINEAGETVLRGGGYQVPRAVHTEWACLPDGLYNFTIYDAIADGSADGNYVMGADFSTLVTSNLNFGSSNTTIFVTGST